MVAEVARTGDGGAPRRLVNGPGSRAHGPRRSGDDTPADAVRRAFTNLEAIGDEAGVALDDMVMMTAMLTDLDDLQTLNDVQAEFFGEPHPPRSTYGVAGLPHGRVELTAVAKRR